MLVCVGFCAILTDYHDYVDNYNYEYTRTTETKTWKTKSQIVNNCDEGVN